MERYPITIHNMCFLHERLSNAKAKNNRVNLALLKLEDLILNMVETIQQGSMEVKFKPRESKPNPDDDIPF